jgi:hypothetical protein
VDGFRTKRKELEELVGKIEECASIVDRIAGIEVEEG